MKNRKELYPEQYTHWIVGKKVRHGGREFTVERVVATRFGKLVIPVGNPEENERVAYDLNQVCVIKEN